MTYQLLDSPRQRYAAGRRLRKRVPRQAHAEWVVVDPSPERLGPLDRVDRGRLPNLLPEKRKRMRKSPFAFYRGSAALMAADLATMPQTGVTVQICGDAHVRNLGAYAALDGRLVFDINDFDETTIAPWEWDVKRLATSLILAGEESGLSQSRCEDTVRVFMRAYREHLGTFATMPFAALSRYVIARRPGSDLLDYVFHEAGHVTPAHNLKKLTVRRRGHVQFHDRPPALERVSERTAAEVLRGLDHYAKRLSPGRAHTFGRYRAVDVAFKLVGTGSVGTRNYVVLLFGNGPGDPLFLQVKQELTSCYAPYLRHAPLVRHQGLRVVEGQQMMQTLSDPFLGYTAFGGHEYLVRQLADHKAALDPAGFDRRTLVEYAALCGEVLAKGHARTGDAAQLIGYAGPSPKLDRAIAAFAITYAEQVRSDHALFHRTHR